MEWYNGRNSINFPSKHFNNVLITNFIIIRTKNKRIINKNIKRNAKEWELYIKECEQIEKRIENEIL